MITTANILLFVEKLPPPPFFCEGARFFSPMGALFAAVSTRNAFVPVEKKGAKIRENRGLRAETTPLFPKNYSEAQRRKTPFDEFSTPKRG
nr:hypothetical protein [uncultured Alloprevotella sp.]